jgi:hypothetical protein
MRSCRSSEAAASISAFSFATRFFSISSVMLLHALSYSLPEMQ